MLNFLKNFQFLIYELILQKSAEFLFLKKMKITLTNLVIKD